MTVEDRRPSFCESCGRGLSADAQFCGGCGEPVSGGGEEVSADPPPTPDPEPERPVLFDAGPTVEDPTPDEEALYAIRPLVLQTWMELLLSFLTLGIVALVLWIRRMQVRYRITSQRIEITNGVFSLQRITIELFRIQDFEIQEPLFLRLRAAGNIVVRSMDVEEQEVVLTGIVQVRDVHERLRAAALAERKRHRVRVLEGM